LSADFDQNWSFAVAIPDVDSAARCFAEGRPDNLPETIAAKVEATIKAALVVINERGIGDGPFSVAISGKGNKVYMSLQEVSRNATL
jgi:hypothetical protein